MRRILTTAALLTAAVGLGGCLIGDLGPSDRYQSPFHFSYDLSPGGRFNLENFNGEVEVTGWDQNTVEITGVKFASSEAILNSLKIEIRNEADSIEIRTVRPSAPFSGAGARYTVHVPRTAVVDRIVTTNGQIQVNNVASAANLRTSNAAIRAGSLRGPLNAQTSNGIIEVREIDGAVGLRTSNGRIRAENITGECDAHTSNGSITIHLTDAPRGPLKAVTSNSPIELTLQRPPQGGIRAETSNGGITLHLPAGTGARLEADTTNSSISTELDVGGHVQGTTGHQGHLEGTIGAGGPPIELATRNGPIRLLRN